MKNIIRILSIFTLAVVLSGILCSCIQLDDMKENRGFFTDESREEFVFHDHTYKKIDVNGNIIFQSETSNGVITDKDVPILLSNEFGYRLCYSEKEETAVIIMIPYYKKDLDSHIVYDDYDYEAYFCLESEYERIKEISDNALFDHMYIGYTELKYDPETGEPNYEYTLALIPDDFQQAIDDVLNNDPKEDLSYEDIKGDFLAMTVTRCDKDMLIAKKNSEIGIIKYKDEFYITFGSYMSDDIYTKVPETYRELFENYFDQYYEMNAVYVNMNE